MTDIKDDIQDVVEDVEEIVEEPRFSVLQILGFGAAAVTVTALSTIALVKKFGKKDSDDSETSEDIPVTIVVQPEDIITD